MTTPQTPQAQPTTAPQPPTGPPPQAARPAPRSAPPRQAPPPPRASGSAPAAMAPAGGLRLAAPTCRKGKRIGIYGAGGIGKTSLAASCPGRTVFIDLDDSLGELGLANVLVVQGIGNWAELHGALQAPGWDGVQNIVIDSATKAEELAVAHTLLTVPHPDRPSAKITRIEDYGFGKGYTFVYETFLSLLGDLDQHAAAGRNVILIAHDCTATVPNPNGEDWIRYEPRLQAPASGKSSIRLRVREWLDHLFFIGYDVAVGEDGKGQGSGTRTIYPNELPLCMAKSRKLDEPIPYWRGDTELWARLFE